MKTDALKKILFAFLFSLPLCLISTAQLGQEMEEHATVTAGWYPWSPYQYLDDKEQLTGLDYALVTAIFQTAGIEVNYDPKMPETWSKNQEDVLSGVKDIAAGAFESEQRRQVYHLSKPYRYESNSLYIRHDLQAKLDVYLLEDLFKLIRQHGFRVGVIRGYTYASNSLNRFINQEINNKSGLIVGASTEEENFDNLISDRVDIVVSDRLVGAQIVWQRKLGGVIGEHQIKLPSKPIHLLIHRDPETEDDVRGEYLLNAFNQGVDQLSQSGEIDAIIGEYLFPVLMNITVQRDWFYAVDILGAIFFALGGFLIAKERQYDIFGTLVMIALLVGGGGIIRDLLVGRTPVIIRIPDYIYIIVSMALIGYLLSFVHEFGKQHSRYYRHRFSWFNHKADLIRELIEAIGLGTYTIVGVGVAVEAKLLPLWIWGPLLGCITSCGGGIIANILRQQHLESMTGNLAPECSLLWGSFFSFFMIWQGNRLDPTEVFLGVIVTLVGCTLTMMLIRGYRLSSPRMQNRTFPLSSRR